MRSRPDVDVRLPTVVHPGDDLPIAIDLESHADTPIDFITLTFDGSETASAYVSDSRPGSTTHTIVAGAEQLRGQGILAAGKHALHALFRLPLDAPRSYRGVQVEIRYEIRLHVSIPWWPDLHETFEILVEPHSAQRPPAAPATAASQRDTTDPFLEISLTDTAFAAGDEITGAFAVGNAGGDGLGVELSLVALERAQTDVGERVTEQFRFSVPTVFQPAAGGDETPFRFRVPKEVVPSFTSAACALEWSLRAVLRGSWSRVFSCAIPLHIGRYQQPREAPRGRPEVGVARWRRVWAEVGAEHGLALADDRPLLRGERGDARIEVTFDEAGERENLDSGDGPTLSAIVRYPSIELGLRASPQLIVMLPTELEALLPGHKIECRDPAQGTAFLRRSLRRALRPFKVTGLDDAHAYVRTPAAGYDPAALRSFIESTLALADALLGAIERIPPPPSMSHALPAWSAFAAATSARLVRGSMTLLAAEIDGALFDIATQLDARGEAVGTRITLPLDPPLAIRTQADGSDTFANALPGWSDLLAAFRAVVKELAILPHVVTVDLSGPVLDPSILRPRLGELLLLVKRLRGERAPGPYR